MSVPQPEYHRASVGNGPVGILLAWVTIVAVLAFVGYRNWTAAHLPRMEQAASDVVLQMEARNAVGTHALFGATPKAASSKQTLQVLRQISQMAHTPREQLRTVPVIGELQGAAAALDELTRIEPALQSSSLQSDARILRTIYTSGVAGVGSDARQTLIEQMGWFGRLALVFGVPASDPGRHAIIASGIRALLATIGFELLVLGIFIAGIWLLTLAVVRLIDGKVRFGYQRPAYPAGPFLEAFALYLAGYVGLSWLIHKFSHAPTWSVYLIDLLWVAFASCWPLLRGVSWPDLKRGLGWQRGRGVFREAGAGIAGYLAGMPLLAMATYATILLSKLGHEHAVHPIVFETGGGLAAIVGLYLMASVWAPIVEETMFRGALFHHLRRGHRWLFSAALSAFIFAALHPQGWTAIPVLGMIGFIFAGIREWRGTTLASATAHALNNAVATTLLILTLG